jgi:hypothetical protein
MTRLHSNSMCLHQNLCQCMQNCYRNLRHTKTWFSKWNNKLNSNIWFVFEIFCWRCWIFFTLMEMWNSLSQVTTCERFYTDVLQHLQRLWWKCSSNWHTGDSFLGHKNAVVHSALSVHDFLPRNCVIVICHPPQSPDPGQYSSILFSNFSYG